MSKLEASKLAEIKAEMLKKGFKYRQSNGIHNFLNAAILQGIELNGEEINPFCIGDETERIYGYGNVGNEVRDMIPIMEDILMAPAREPQDEAKAHKGILLTPDEVGEIEDAKVHKGEVIPPATPNPPDTPNPPEKIPDQAGLITGVIPQYLTNELIDNHPGTIPALLSMQKTAPMYIKSREKGMKYVDVSYMTTALNLATLMDWSFEAVETRVDDMEEKKLIKKHISVLGRLTVNTTEGKTIIKEQWGSQVLKSKMEMGDAIKAATSDALKKCASMLGIAADVYGGVYND